MRKIHIFLTVLFLSIYTQAQPANTSETNNEIKSGEANTSSVLAAAKKSENAPVKDVKTVANNTGKIALPPEKANPVRVPQISVPVVIDGKLDDDSWKTAAVFKDFYQTNPG